MEYIADSPLLAHNCKFDIMARARRFERRRLRASRTFPGSQARNARVTRTVACCFESWILTERSSCFNRTFSSLRCCFSSLVSSKFKTALSWRPCSSLCFTSSLCLCSSTFSRTIFSTIDLAWSSYLATASVLVSSSFNLDSKKTQKNLIFLLKKATQPRKNLSFAWKILSFFTQKDLPASLKTEFLHKKMTKKVLKKVPKRPPSPAKTEVLHEKKCLFLLKNTTQPRKKLKFCIKKWQKID